MKVDVAVLGSPPLMVSVDVKQHCSLCIPVEAIVMYVEMCHLRRCYYNVRRDVCHVRRGCYVSRNVCHVHRDVCNVHMVRDVCHVYM